MRRNVRGQQDDLIETERAAGALCDVEMAHVDRIERAAE